MISCFMVYTSRKPCVIVYCYVHSATLLTTIVAMAGSKMSLQREGMNCVWITILYSFSYIVT